jgi:hypothetical protein
MTPAALVWNNSGYVFLLGNDPVFCDSMRAGLARIFPRCLCFLLGRQEEPAEVREQKIAGSGNQSPQSRIVIYANHLISYCV